MSVPEMMLPIPILETTEGIMILSNKVQEMNQILEPEPTEGITILSNKVQETTQMLEPEPTMVLQIETTLDKKPERKTQLDTSKQILAPNHLQIIIKAEAVKRLQQPETEVKREVTMPEKIMLLVEKELLMTEAIDDN